LTIQRNMFIQFFTSSIGRDIRSGPRLQKRAKMP
jgi:hypothetical protein